MEHSSQTASTSRTVHTHHGNSWQKIGKKCGTVSGDVLIYGSRVSCRAAASVDTVGRDDDHSDQDEDDSSLS